MWIERGLIKPAEKYAETKKDPTHLGMSGRDCTY